MADYAGRRKTILPDHDCYFERPAKGNHELWASPLSKRRFTVPKKIKSRHTANAILKQAGLPKAF